MKKKLENNKQKISYESNKPNIISLDAIATHPQWKNFFKNYQGHAGYRMIGWIYKYA